ncbi:hypothetical protein VP1G_04710 [Cytospora mali]|uniref:Uncharacterized protein n=1 Tax=Cytospora mali TaxID=578113 RepID=A0A194V0A0_CYTMA|nr:hypothetical protein VP1G_04710 [Valsa mali var. pyri (nom. inval.)]
MSNSTSRSAKGAATLSKRVTDTTSEELETMMLNAQVTGLFLEALGNQSLLVADPKKEELGKKKNHWVLRLEIADIFYTAKGKKIQCSSVRVSVERDPGSMKCSKMTLKPLSYKGSVSTSALAHFKFKLLRPNLDVVEVAKVAQVAELAVVAVVAVVEGPAETNNYSSIQMVAVISHCYVRANVELAGTTFHHIIGYRYSADRIDKNPIAKAEFPSSYNRVLGPFEVTLVDGPDVTDGVTIVDADKRTYSVNFPYRAAPVKVEIFKK